VPAAHDQYAARAAGDPSAIGVVENGELTVAEGGAGVLIVDSPFRQIAVCGK
jgi:hypothetical protein